MAALCILPSLCGLFSPYKHLDLTLKVVSLQIMVCKAALKVNFYLRFLFAVRMENDTACSWPWKWWRASGQHRQKFLLLMASGENVGEMWRAGEDKASSGISRESPVRVKWLGEVHAGLTPSIQPLLCLRILYTSPCFHETHSFNFLLWLLLNRLLCF